MYICKYPLCLLEHVSLPSLAASVDAETDVKPLCIVHLGRAVLLSVSLILYNK